MTYTLFIYHADGRVRLHFGNWLTMMRWWDALQHRAFAGQLSIVADDGRLVVFN